MHTAVKYIEDKNKKKQVPRIVPGDTVRVYQKIREGDKERTQMFEGVVVTVKNTNNLNYTIRVRKISSGVGVERTFPVHAPLVEKITVVKRSKPRRANLSYLRGLTGKKAKLKDREFEVLMIGEEEKELDQELTEIVPEEAGDPLKEAVSTDGVAEVEEHAAEVQEKGKEEKTLETEGEGDETQTPAEEVQEGLDRADEEDTRGQSDEKPA